MRRGTLWLLLLAALLIGPTWPEDDKGRPAAQCSFIGSAGTPTLCSTTDPLPMAAATTSSTDPTGWGRLWFASATTFGRQGSGVFTSDQDLVFTKVNAVGTALEVFNSTNAGRSWVLGQTLSAVPAEIPFAFPNQVETLLRSTTGRYILGMQCSGCTVGLWIGNGFTTTSWTEPTITGLPAAFRLWPSVAQQGSTILAAVSEAGDARICRSTNDGLNFACVDPAGVTNLQYNALASPALNTWLAVDNTAPNRNIARSTDDGVTWANVTAIADGGLAGSAITCLTASVCLAGAGANFYRSTNAGLTWLRVYEDAGGTASLMSVVNFGSGVVSFMFGDAATSLIPVLSTDSGQTWNRLPAVTLGGAAVTGSGNSTSRAGKAVFFPIGATVNPAYSPTVSGRIIQGESGIAWNINALGEGGVYQGTPGANPWPVAGPAQRGTLFNTRTVSAVNTAVSATITAVAGQRGHVFSVNGRCSAGTSDLLVQDGATTIWDTAAAEVGVTNFRVVWSTGLTGTAGNAMTVTLATCGVGNTGTLSVQADRY